MSVGGKRKPRARGESRRYKRVYFEPAPGVRLRIDALYRDDGTLILSAWREEPDGSGWRGVDLQGG